MIDGRSGSTQMKYLFDTKFKCLKRYCFYTRRARVLSEGDNINF